MPYELTQIRLHLQRFMKEIGDALTSPEDIARYEDFNSKMKKLADTTGLHYKNKLPLVPNLRKMLQDRYNEALEAAVFLANSPEDAGPTAERLKLIAQELIPLMQMDLQALDLIESKGNPDSLTLPELLGQVRMQAADLGEAEGPADGRPMPLRVESEDDVQLGVFTPAGPGGAAKPETAYSRLSAILGKPDLTARATPMLLMHKGGSTAGTFVSRADGLDPAQLTGADPFLFFGPENLDTEAAVTGVSSAALLNVLCGMPANGSAYSLRFDPPYSTPGAPARLVGLTVKPDGIRFDAGPADADELKKQLDSLGVVSAEMVNMLSADGFAEQLRYMLHDCGLPAETADRILERRDILLEKIREDAAHYNGKAPGYVEPGRIRVVPEAEMGNYHLNDLASAAPQGPFAALKGLPEKTRENIQRKEAEARANAAEHAQPVSSSYAPTARLIGTGLSQEPDPYDTARPETVKLHIPLLGAQAMQGGVNMRHPIGFEENGKMRKGVFTLPNVHSVSARISDILEPYLNDPAYAPYQDMVKALANYYHLSDKNMSKPELPLLPDLPWAELGIPQERADELMGDNKVKSLYQSINSKMMKASMLMNMEDRVGTDRGQRIEMRNVAMSDVGDVLGVPKLLARAVPAKAELNGKIVDGVFMEEAEGVDLSKVKPGTAPAAITADMNAEVFNTKGLKDLADLEILDYICLNRDRHGKNMFYKFADLETGHPKFLGVQGIDNDFSFLTEVPRADEEVGFLAKLNDIKVISESMAQTLRKPETMDLIAEKMRRNGLSEVQIAAARERFAQIKKKLDKGKLDVVRDDQWGKGKYRIETLGAGTKKENTSIFGRFNRTVIAQLNNMAAAHPVQPEQFIPMEDLEVQTVQRVEAFGDATLRAAELAELQKQAEKDFLAQSAAATKTGPLAENPEHQAVFDIHSVATALKAQLDAGRLPWPWGNRSYRKMHTACEDLLKFTGKLTEKLRQDPEAEISEADSKKLNDLIRNASDKSVAYWTYKVEDLKAHDPGESTARRQQAAKNCNEMMNQRYYSYKAARKERRRPLHLVQEKIRELQSGLGTSQGEELREKAAEIIYLNGLTRMDIEHKSGMGIRRALTGAKLGEQTQRVMEASSFKKLAAMSDGALRALAAGQGGTDLADRFIQEIAKEQQLKNSPKPQGYQAPAPAQEPPQPNLQ